MTTPAAATSATSPTSSSSVLDQYSVKNANEKVPTSSNEVSKDSFLNLLVTQLQNQDPLQPVQNTEFIAQLAQFQSLESQLDTNTKIGDLVSLQQSQLALSGLSQAALLVGKNVSWTDKDGKTGAGTVQSVTVENGVMMINTDNGKVPVGALTSIALGPNQTGAGTGTGSGSGSTTGSGSGTGQGSGSGSALFGPAPQAPVFTSNTTATRTGS